jgi:3-methyladenine DNA glycosylase/8-oxoguanine DNA glycosylase
VARELAARHPRLARLVEVAHPIRDRIPDRRPLSELAVSTVVSQLVSTAAARTIKARLLEGHGTIDGVIAWAMAQPDDAPSSHGLSRGGDS